jgi:hypothetical protein
MGNREKAEAALNSLNHAERADDIIACALTSIAYSLLASQDGAAEATEVQIETQRKIQEVMHTWGDALAAVEAVLELHEPDGDYCGECSIHDAVTYPCPTVAAIRTALGEAW